VHPRIGAADVVPFVPVSGVTAGGVRECLARQAGLEIWRRAGVPVYFYEAAAARPDRVNLEEFAAASSRGCSSLRIGDPARRPGCWAGRSCIEGRSDGGGRAKISDRLQHFSGMPKSAGDISEGPPLAAQADIAAARAIARAIRASAGGLHGVKAIGLNVDGRAQVSMNITDFRATPCGRSTRRCANWRATTARCERGELIGLVPQEAYDADAEWLREIPASMPSQGAVERRLEHPLPWPGA